MTEPSSPRCRARLAVSLVVAATSGVSLALGIFHSRVHPDTHHWGLQYSTAFDLLHGQIIYRDTLESYGALNGCLHALALLLLGPTYLSLGIATSAIYALSFPLLYVVARAFLPRALAVLSTALFFLLSPHFEFPWPDYMALVFLLAALAALRLRGRWRPTGFLLAGLCIAFALLSRNTFVISILPAFAVTGGLAVLLGRSRLPRREIALFTLGLSVPLAVFATYLWHYDLVASWRYQTFFLFSDFWYDHLGVSDLDGGARIWFLLTHRLWQLIHVWESASWAMRAYGVVFATNLLAALYLFGRLVRAKDSACLYPFLVALLTLGGFLQSPHVLAVWRLQTICGPGVAILVWMAYRLGRSSQAAVAIVAAGWLAIALIPTSTRFASGLSWRPAEKQAGFSYLLERVRAYRAGELAAPKEALLWGKLLPVENAEMFDRLAGSIARYACHATYVVNLSPDATLTYLDPRLKKIQVAPYGGFGLSRQFTREHQAPIDAAVATAAAIVFADEAPRGYRVIDRFNVRATDVVMAIPEHFAPCR